MLVVPPTRFERVTPSSRKRESYGQNKALNALQFAMVRSSACLADHSIEDPAHSNAFEVRGRNIRTATVPQPHRTVGKCLRPLPLTMRPAIETVVTKPGDRLLVDRK